MADTNERNDLKNKSLNKKITYAVLFIIACLIIVVYIYSDDIFAFDLEQDLINKQIAIKQENEYDQKRRKSAIESQMVVYNHKYKQCFFGNKSGSIINFVITSWMPCTHDVLKLAGVENYNKAIINSNGIVTGWLE